jgi:hypothetical protein
LTGHPATDPAIGLPPFGPFANLAPGAGWESALGFDHRLAGCEATAAPLPVKANPASCGWSPYHISGQFRYGQNNGVSDPFTHALSAFTLGSGLATASGVANAIGSASLGREDHWLVDFAIGRDFALGSGTTQAKLGVRVAEITSTATGAGALQGCANSSVNSFPVCTQVTGNTSFQSRSQFLGVGPRLGIDGSQPLAGSWAFDYLGGLAVLFGNRSFNATQTLFATVVTAAPPITLNSLTALSLSNTVAVFNLDVQAGISYWLTSNFKLTVSYRFDGYWNALTIIEPDGGLGSQGRFYYGPMLRGSLTFN